MMSEYVVKLVTFIYLFIFRQLFYVNLFIFFLCFNIYYFKNLFTILNDSNIF